MFDYCSKTEAEIAKAIVRRALSMGYAISVHDGEEANEPSIIEHDIFQAMNSTDSDTLIFWTGQRKVGWVWLIWGNEEDLISDSSDNMEIDNILNI